MKTSKLGEPPFKIADGGWTYKGEAKTPDEIAEIANSLYLDFAVSLIDNRPLTREEIEYAVELERRMSDAAAKEQSMSFARYGYDDDRESYGDEEKPLREDGFYMHQCKCPCGHIFEVKWHKDIADWGVRETCPHCGNIYDEDDLAFEEINNLVEQVLRQMGDELREANDADN